MSLQENKLIIMEDFVGNSSEKSIFDEFPIEKTVGSISSENNFVGIFSGYLTNFRRINF